MSKTAATILDGLARAAAALTGGQRDATLARLSEKVIPRLTVNTVHGPIVFSCPSKSALFYPRTIFTNEPETLAWIDGFDDGDTLWDIGASVGVYSLYAALRPGIRALAFEPGAESYATLNRNIRLNRLGARVSAYCLAFDEETAMGRLDLPVTEAGAVAGTFRRPSPEAPNHGSGQGFAQGSMGYSVDGFMAAFDPPFPDHIKIDVDGIEGRVVAGARQAIADGRLKSLMIEVNDPQGADGDAIVGTLEGAGLGRRDDLVAEARREGGGSAVNMLFKRGR